MIPNPRVGFEVRPGSPRILVVGFPGLQVSTASGDTISNRYNGTKRVDFGWQVHLAWTRGGAGLNRVAGPSSSDHTPIDNHETDEWTELLLMSARVAACICEKYSKKRLRTCVRFAFVPAVAGKGGRKLRREPCDWWWTA